MRLRNDLFFRTALLAVAFSSLIATERSEACSCAPLNSRVSEMLSSAEAVFVGIPTFVAVEPDHRNPARSENITQFKVVAGFKGVNEQVDVRSERPGMCGISFTKNVPYLVFAHKREGSEDLRTSLCAASTVDSQNSMVTDTLLQLPAVLNR